MRNETRAPRPARMERRAAGRVGEERAAGAANGRAGERVRGSCRGTCAASSPRRAPRAAPANVLSLYPRTERLSSYTAVRHPGSARVCRRHDAHVVRFRGALHHQYTGNTTATASGGSPRPVGVRPDARQ